MSYPTGVDLPGLFFFTRNGQLADPTSPPVIQVATYPDGSLLAAPPALVRLAPGVYRCAVVFSGAETTTPGDYSAFVSTTDTTVERPTTFWFWEVRAPVKATDSTAALAELQVSLNALQTKVDALKAELDGVKAKTDTISLSSTSGVPSTAALTIYTPSTALAVGSLNVTFIPVAAAV